MVFHRGVFGVKHSVSGTYFQLAHWPSFQLQSRVAPLQTRQVGPRPYLMAMELKASNGEVKLLVHHSEVPAGVTQASSAKTVLQDCGRSCRRFSHCLGRHDCLFRVALSLPLEQMTFSMQDPYVRRPSTTLPGQCELPVRRYSSSGFASGGPARAEEQELRELRERKRGAAT